MNNKLESPSDQAGADTDRMPHLDTSRIPQTEQETHQPWRLNAYLDRRRCFVFAVALQLAFVVGLAVPRVTTLLYGQVAVLKAAPVDPRDLFRGDYVTLGYDISRITNADAKTGEPIYVVLKEREPYWTLAYSSRTRPVAGQNEIVLKGKVNWVDATGTASVTYGTERLFVPEGKGRDLERKLDGLKIEVSVDQEGSACIRRVIDQNRVVMDASNLFKPHSANL